MAISSDEVLIQAIAHSIRREILRNLRESPKTFTELLNHFDIATSKLNYHLKLLEGFLKKTPEGKYALTPLGQRAITVMELIQKEMSHIEQADQPFVKDAYIAQNQTNDNFITNIIGVGIVGVGMVIGFWVIFFIAMLFDPTTPIYVYLILIGLIIAFSFFMRHLLDTRKSADTFIKRVEEHLTNT